MRLIRSAAPFLFALPLFACEGENIARVEGKLDAPEVVDFGDVQIGIIQPMNVDVKNIGSAVVTVDQIEQTNFTGANYEFRLSKNSLSLQAGQTETLVVTFQAFEAMADPIEASFRMTWQINPDETMSRTVVVRARGVETGLEVVPNPIDLSLIHI